ncbi:MFS transporter [Thalassospira alkalitolerans]|uniref:MFS transporter n=1 Tax=Thalassospira alkalitolerans TaxID=1293890 RepID=UPI0030EDE603|tara:strand:- start:46278 stop:47519 length:1242 start_codon:yes stop_codon:yes gene_type:complete
MMAGVGQPLSVRWQIHLLFVIQLVSMGAMEMSGPFWPVHLRSLSHSDGVFTFASIAVYVGPMLGIMLTSTFWGRLGDRYGHKAMMMRALLGLAITQLALAYANDVWLILMLRFFQGACAGYIAPAQAYGVSIESPAKRAKLFAYLQVSTNVGSLGGALVGGVILDHAAFFWINFSAAVLCAACLVSVWILLPVVAPKDRARAAITNATPVEKVSILRSPQIVSLLTILGVLLLGRMVTQSPFSIYVLSIFDVGNWVVGLCYGLLALGFVTSASLWARYFEGRTARDVLGGMCLVIAGCVVVTLLAGFTRSIFVFTAMYFVWGVLLGATTPVLTALVSRAAGDHRQGHVLGLAQSTAQFASIAGIALGGWFSQAAGLSNIYFLVGFVYAMGLVLTVFVRARAGFSARPSEIPGE